MYNQELDCNCTNLDHHKFDNLMNQEFATPILVENIVSESFCISFDFEHFDENLNLSSHDILKELKDKMGVYCLWVYEGQCTEHDMHRMLCLYVGKGFVFDRVKSHIKTKWPHCETLYITFFECKNRFAKYIEQLFLDSYEFYLNKEENSGTGYLAAMWDEERFTHGTQLEEHAELLANKFPEQFQ